GVIGLKFHHRPDRYSGGGKRLLEKRKLSEEVGLDAFAGFIARPQTVAEGFDDVVCCNGDIRSPALDHSQYRGEYAANRGHFMAVPITRGRQREVMAEEFVGAVDQMNVQGSSIAGATVRMEV